MNLRQDEPGTVNQHHSVALPHRLQDWRGGMGEVYLAEDMRLRRNVAGQTLSASIAQDKVRLHRFEVETFECILPPAQFRTFRIHYQTTRGRGIGMSLVQRRFKLFVVIFLISLSILAVWVDSQTVSANSDATTEFFEKRIRPILMTNCSPCHNPQAYIAKLDLTTAEGFARGGESGALINPANPETSRLLQVIGYSETLKMPPKGKLQAGEIAALTEWVKMGAPWAKTAAVQPQSKWTASKSTREFTDEEKAFWAYQQLAQVAPPKVKNRNWVKSPIDAFVLQKLEEKGISPAPPADKLT
jgi:hypothetical protein